MKLYAQSQVPRSPNYLHIGYAAAAVLNTKVYLSAMMLIGAVLIVAAVARAVRGWVSLRCADAEVPLARWCRFRRVGPCAVLLVVGLAVIMLAARLRGLAMTHTTRRYTLILAGDIEYSLTLDEYNVVKPAPEDIAPFLMEAFGSVEEDFLDAWGRPYRIAREMETGRARYVITSSGRDGELGTDDDIRQTTEWIAFPESESGKSAPEEAAVRPATDSAVSAAISSQRHGRAQ